MTKVSRIRERLISILSQKKSETSQSHRPESDPDLELQLTIAILRRLKVMSAELDALTANVAKLSTSVDTLIAKVATGVPAAAVQAQADAVAAIDAKVVAASA